MMHARGVLAATGDHGGRVGLSMWSLPDLPEVARTNRGHSIRKRAAWHGDRSEVSPAELSRTRPRADVLRREIPAKVDSSSWFRATTFRDHVQWTGSCQRIAGEARQLPDIPQVRDLFDES